MKFELSKAVILLLFSVICVSKTFTRPDSDTYSNYVLQNQNVNFMSKFYKFGLLSSSGNIKSRNLTSGSKFNSLSPPNCLTVINILLLLSGIEPNPGPRGVRFPCGVCKKSCTKNQSSVACDNCNKWFHKDCLMMNTQIFSALKNISWYCCHCGLPTCRPCYCD